MEYAGMASDDPRDNNTQPRDKLGLALAGGGFRASLFHVGVLRRMAEQDLLRYLEVLSTVSGGSIVGALYILLLKRELENKALLTQADYLKIINDLEQRLCTAIKKNLRMRLLMNPFGILRVMLSGYSLGQRMSRLYERYIFAGTVNELANIQTSCGWLASKWIPTWLKKQYAPGRILLNDIRISPGRYENNDNDKTASLLAQGIESYNQNEVKNNGSVITQLIINSTSLNSGSRFWFSAVEMGDWDLGNIRKGEIDKLLQRKKLIIELQKQNTLMARYRHPAHSQAKPPYYAFALWWVDSSNRPVDGYEPLFDSFMTPVIELMRDAEPGILRSAKLPAWYLRHGYEREPIISGGLSQEQHLYKVITALGNMGRVRRDRVEAWITEDDKRCGLLLDFIIELYLFRMAEHTAPSIRRDWDRLTLGDAVAASANFPPLFPPFQLTGIYDDIVISRLGLTDGGVFDNIGFTGLLDEHCNQIIASDTGGPLNKHQRSSTGRFGMSTRIINILSSTDARQSKEYLLERYRHSTELCRELNFMLDANNNVSTTNATTDQHPVDNPVCYEHVYGIQARVANLLANRELLGLAMFSIDSRDACHQQNQLIPAADLARMRTDLDIFSDIEMYALMDQGYTNANHYINRYLVPEKDEAGYLDPKDQYRYRIHPCPYSSDGHVEHEDLSHWRHALLAKQKTLSLSATKSGNRFFHKLFSHHSLIEDTITASAKSFFRTLHLKIITPWLILFSAFIFIALMSNNIQLSAHSVSQWVYQSGIENLSSLLYFLPDNWESRRFNLSSIFIIISILLLAYSLITLHWFKLVDWLKKKAWIKLSRFMAMISHIPQSYAGNLLWLIWLPLPLLMAFSISLLVISNHAFYRFVILPRQSLDD